MLKRVLAGSVAALIAAYGALLLSGYGMLYLVREVGIGPILDHGGQFPAYEVHYFTGAGTFRAVYPQGFGAEDPPLMRKPPSKAEVAEAERWLNGEEL